MPERAVEIRIALPQKIIRVAQEMLNIALENPEAVAELGGLCRDLAIGRQVLRHLHQRRAREREHLLALRRGD